MPKRLYIETVGCQMNVLDSELVAASLLEAGYELTDSIRRADAILFNTCSVRQHAEDKIYSALGRLKHVKEQHPGKIIGVVGCMAQKDQQQIFKRAPHVDLVVGPGQIHQIPELLRRIDAGQGPQLEVSLDRKAGSRSLVQESFERYDPQRSAEARAVRHQAMVRIMLGCDKFCTYCIVPSVRGPEQSRPAAEIVAEVRQLTDQGCREVTLLGQTVNSYRDATTVGRTTTLADLLAQLNAIAGLVRIRFVTNYPRHMTADLLQAVRDLPRVAPYLHVPVQSGSNEILARMKRGYTVEEYREMLAAIRQTVPQAAVTSDFIVGFCGETEEDFQRSMDLVRQSHFKNSFIFKYSARTGTVAARRYADDVSDEVKRRRNNDMLALQNEICLEDNVAWVGRRAEILVEGPSKVSRKHDPDAEVTQLVGRTACDRIVVFEGPRSLAGQILTLPIEKADAFTLFGRWEAVEGAFRRSAFRIPHSAFPMNVATVRYYLDNPEAAADWLHRLGIGDVQRAHGNLLSLATSGMTLDLVAEICAQAGPALAASSDPDRVLDSLDQFVKGSRNPLGLGALFERDRGALSTLLQIFSVSQHLSGLLIQDPESYDLVRLTEGQPVARQYVVDEIVAEIETIDHDPTVLRTLRRFKHRETLRIAYGDVIREQSLSTVTRQISYLADALVEAAFRAAWRKVRQQRGMPLRPDGQPARFVVLGMGKLGGTELNYSSDIDLIFLYEAEGKTDGSRSISNSEFFDRLSRELLRLLGEKTELGAPYRVDMRLRPDGQRGPLAISVPAALSYYDIRGRTWERQAYIKARPVAGDLPLGEELLGQLQPWIYRRYLSRADISGIKALKRRIEQRTRTEGEDQHNVKTGHGGIRDIEFTIQFLQLLNGGDLPELRTGNTLEAILKLESVGCLSNLERTILEENYSFLRKLEHRLQIMFDLQTHVMPTEPGELRKLALRMGYAELPERPALETFVEEYRSKTDLNRKILDHLLNDAFPDDAATEAAVDLVLDPDPSDEEIVAVLGQYGFRDVKHAYRILMTLAEEKIRFLSTRRCRHFLAAIAPQLLEAVAATPDPDSTLVNLDKVSESLGGKGVLWELFSFNPPSLRLCVDLCAYSPYLSSILISNPGMIDGLMDSLLLDKLPALQSLRETAADLCHAAEDIDPILHSFKNDQQLRVGVRDILGKEDVQATTGALSNIAEACLEQIAARESEKLVERFGTPRIDEGPRAGQPCEMVILALGKFGGQEMNYYSDLDIIFLYEADGHTTPSGPRRTPSTSNQHFFSELGQRIIKDTSRLSAYGRLYEVDARLRPTGKSGSLATSLAEFGRYFAEGSGQLWERQALCKARVAYGTPRAAAAALAAVGHAAFDRPWTRDDAEAIRQMRQRLQETVGSGNLKRGAGGIVDVEFLVQMFQLKHGRKVVALRHSNTLTALAALHAHSLLSDEDFQLLDQGYRVLRTIESRLRLMNSTARDKLPDDPTELAKLARLLRYPTAEALMQDFRCQTQRIREGFDRIFDRQGD